MTITSVYAPDTYSGDGSTTTFAITFPFLSVSTNVKVSIKVVATGVITLKTAATHYNVTGSNVVFTAGNIPASGETVIIELDPDFTQDSDYTTNSALPAETLEADLDERCLEAQINKDLISRTIKLDSSVDISSFDTTLPDASANGIIGFNSGANGLAVISLGDISAVTLPLSLANGGLGSALSDPGADRILFWDDSAGAHAYLTAGAGLSISGTTLTSDLVSDTTPQLGGTLDVNGNTIGDGTEVVNINATALSINNAATGPGEIRLVEDSDNGSNYLAFKSPSAVTTTTTFTLPDGDGTADQVIKTNGSGTLSWTDAGGGALTFISSATASTSSTIDFTSGIDSTYDFYEIHFSDVYQSGVGIYLLRTSTDGGSTFDSNVSDYSYVVVYSNDLGGPTRAAGSPQSYIYVTGTQPDTVAAGAASGIIRIYNPSSTGSYCKVTSESCYEDTTGSIVQSYSVGYRKSAGDVDAIRIYPSTGTFTAGTFRLYGIKTS